MDSRPTLGIFGRRFDSAGGPEGTEFQVNTYTTYGLLHAAQRSRADDERDFVVVWSAAYAIDGSGSGVFGQRFASDGNFLGTEFQVNSYTRGYQLAPSVSSNGERRLRRCVGR